MEIMIKHIYSSSEFSKVSEDQIKKSDTDPNRFVYIDDFWQDVKKAIETL